MKAKPGFTSLVRAGLGQGRLIRAVCAVLGQVYLGWVGQGWVGFDSAGSMFRERGQLLLMKAKNCVNQQAEQVGKIDIT